MEKKSYPAVRIRQTHNSGDLVLFAAPATDIEDWSGVPQRERLGENETVGFQREEKSARVKDLATFFADDKNVIQNPLLCASRKGGDVAFKASVDDDTATVVPGALEISWEDLDSLSLLDILRRLKASLETRLDRRAGQEVDLDLLARLKERANIEGPSGINDESDDESDDEGNEGTDEGADSGADSFTEATSALFTDETHIDDFYNQVAGRVKVLEEIGDTFDDDSFLGFSKSAMIAYLQPIIVVDGQHRLRGALSAATSALEAASNKDEIVEALANGGTSNEISDKIRRREARVLPVSLLLDVSPEEQVFQFVVVNQKATPIHKALLGTIVSTSLTSDELSRVADRLDNAGIPLEDSQVSSSISRDSASPFLGLVQTGMSGDNGDLLRWDVLVSLTKIFRKLDGGKLYHEPKLDYAKLWKSKCLTEDFAKWSDRNGTWRKIFMAFFSAVRDELASTDPDDKNYWGKPRDSNLFNQVSLTILSADFFKFLYERRVNDLSSDNVVDLVDEWLSGVNRTYFNRDWQLTGVKKSSTGTKAQWSQLWSNYRQDPTQLPQAKAYRVSKGN